MLHGPDRSFSLEGRIVKIIHQFSIITMAVAMVLRCDNETAIFPRFNFETDAAVLPRNDMTGFRSLLIISIY
jgi:hypothetical protein